MFYSSLDHHSRESVVEINRQVLRLVCSQAKNNLIKAQLLFDLPESLVAELAKVNIHMLDNLSRQPVCLLTLKNCHNVKLWQDLIISAKNNSPSYRFNLESLALIHLRNELED